MITKVLSSIQSLMSDIYLDENYYDGNLGGPFRDDFEGATKQAREWTDLYAIKRED